MQKRDEVGKTQEAKHKPLSTLCPRVKRVQIRMRPYRFTQPLILNWWINRVPAGYGWGKGGRCCLCRVESNSVCGMHAGSRSGAVRPAQTAIRLLNAIHLIVPACVYRGEQLTVSCKPPAKCGERSRTTCTKEEWRSSGVSVRVPSMSRV